MCLRLSKSLICPQSHGRVEQGLLYWFKRNKNALASYTKRQRRKPLRYHSSCRKRTILRPLKFSPVTGAVRKDLLPHPWGFSPRLRGDLPPSPPSALHQNRRLSERGAEGVLVLIRACKLYKPFYLIGFFPGCQGEIGWGFEGF